MIGVPDFDRVVRQYTDCWNLENHDAPLLQITAPKDGTVYRTPPLPLPERWTDVEHVIACARERMNNTYYGGASYPFLWPNLGPDIFGAIMGCGLEFGDSTSWAVHMESELKDITFPPLDDGNKWWRKIQEMTAAILDDAKGDYIVAITDLHAGMDGLVSLRGPEALCVDLIEEPELVKQLNMDSFQLYKQVYTRLDDMIRERQTGSTNWMGIFHPDRWYVSSCDFMCMISEDMYREFVEPELLLEIELYQNSIFHLDGPDALKHLDSLLAIDALAGIQWVYGAGQPTAAHWLEVLRRIQAAGKMIHIDATEDDLPTLKDALQPEGLILNVSCSSEQRARELEAYVANWKR